MSTKTVTAAFYRAWGSHNSKHIDLYYRKGDPIKSFDGHDLDELRALARAWAIINGFTHMAQGGSRWKL
jgi:hypothetical protein